MRQMKATLRQNLEDYLKFVERAVLCGVLGVAVGTLARTPQVVDSPVLWLMTVIVLVIGGAAAAIATAALYADVLGAQITSRKAKTIAIFGSWCFLLGVVLMAFTFSSKIVVIQDKDASTVRNQGAVVCTSVADCSK